MIALAESGYHEPVNVGNPDEFTLLELAETVIEVTGSSSEIVYEALPDRRPASCASRTSRSRSELLGWEPEVALRDGPAAHDRAVGRRGADRRRRSEHLEAREPLRAAALKRVSA